MSADVVPFEADELRKLKDAAKVLADMPDLDRVYWLPKRAKEIGVEEKILRSAVHTELNERAKRTAAESLAKDLERKQREQQRLAEQREIDRIGKEEKKEEKRRRDAEKKAELKDILKAERDKHKADLKAEREKREANKEAERKAKEKKKGFDNLRKLPADRYDGELIKLAKRLGVDDLETLRQEFKDFVGVAEGVATSDEDVEPWPDPVDPVALLQAIDDKTAKHVVMQPHQRTAVALWVTMSWVHNEIATFSPILVTTSPDEGSGKTTLFGTVARLVPKPSLHVESTGPNVYRFVDARKPTLILDEADDLFVRKSDLKHVINASWARGTKIPRQVKIDGVWITVEFDPFCPKAIGLLGRNLPRTLKSRAIEIRMQPPRADETVEAFKHVDDFEFATLRRQLARFARDHTAALKTAQPTSPAGVSNRVAMNWEIMLAIAELAGGSWPQRARETAVRLTRTGRQPSDGVKLLAAMQNLFKQQHKKVITSETVVEKLCQDPTDIWASYNHGGRITQRQIAALLDPYGIHPDTTHPTGRSNFSRKGYRLEQFIDAWARYLPADPDIRTPTVTAVKKRRRKARELKTGKRGIRKHAQRRNKRSVSGCPDRQPYDENFNTQTF
jgi:putative DNA primase/helicase